MLDVDEIARHQLTTEEIREYCSDMKVLGKPALKYDHHTALFTAAFDLLQYMILNIDVIDVRKKILKNTLKHVL